MGLLRIFCIFAGLAVCCEIPGDDGTVLFRSFFAFFIMLALDYARMWIKGASIYEKGLGLFGLILCLLISLFNWLASGREFVLKKVEATYLIVNSPNFRLFPNFHLNLDTYFAWVALLTMATAAAELAIPHINRYTEKRKASENVEEMSGETKESRRPREQKGSLNLEGTTGVSGTANGGGL